jgi:gamma-glutamyl-gamma-aminobutyrate hydrolase PuuD
MKNILITQGLYKDHRNNLFTKLDFDWFIYAKKNNFRIQQIPITLNLNYLKNIKYDGVIFSGGNDLYKNSKNEESLIRDTLEKKLIKYFLKKKKPMMFVCRGMQLISTINKSKLIKIKNHVIKNHKIIMKNGKFLNVNSYHNYSFDKIPKGFSAIAKHSRDNSIEIMDNKPKKMLCLMFHPERKSKNQKEVDKIFTSFFKLK